MPKPVLESKVESVIVHYAKAHGVWTRKFVAPATAGVPDRIFIYRGHVQFLEIKRPGGKPTKLQEFTMEQMIAVGAHVSWVDNVADGKRVISQMLKRQHPLL